MCILLTGCNGQLGSAILPMLQAIAPVAAPDRREFNLENLAAVRRYILDLKPRVLVNAAAFTAVDAAELQRRRAFKINAEAPAVIAEALRQTGGTLLHVSTDYVFSGTKRSPYIEQDIAEPRSVYGASKLAGEVAIGSSGIPHLILRTGWLMSSTRPGFADMVLKSVSRGTPIRLVRQWGAPTSAHWLAATCARLTACIFDPTRDQGLAGCATRKGTTLNATAAGSVDRYGVVTAILEAAELEGFPHANMPTVEYVAPDYFGATRPEYCILDSSRLNALTGQPSPAWTTTIAEVVPAALARLAARG